MRPMGHLQEQPQPGGQGQPRLSQQGQGTALNLQQPAMRSQLGPSPAQGIPSSTMQPRTQQPSPTQQLLDPATGTGLLARRAAAAVTANTLQLNPLETKSPFGPQHDIVSIAATGPGATQSVLARRALAAHLGPASATASSPSVTTGAQSPPSPTTRTPSTDPATTSGLMSPGTMSRQQAGLMSPGGSSRYLTGPMSPGGMSRQQAGGLMSPGGGSRHQFLLGSSGMSAMQQQGSMRMSFSGIGSPSMRMSSNGTMQRATRKKPTVKEFVAHHFWQHYEKYRAAQVVSIHSDSLDMSGHHKPVQLSYATMEYGMMSSSYDVHVTQVLQAQRDREDALPLRRDDGHDRWAAFLASMSREDAAAIVIQRWWRALMEFRRINWPELYKPLQQVEKPPVYVWSSSESEEEAEQPLQRRTSYQPRKRPGNRAGFGTSAAKPMNKNRMSQVAMAESKEVVEEVVVSKARSGGSSTAGGRVKDPTLIWGTAAPAKHEHHHGPLPPDIRPPQPAGSKYMAGVGTTALNMRRKKKRSTAHAGKPGTGNPSGADSGAGEDMGAEDSAIGPWPEDSGAAAPFSGETRSRSLRTRVSNRSGRGGSLGRHGSETTAETTARESGAEEEEGGRLGQLPPDEWEDDTPESSEGEGAPSGAASVRRMSVNTPGPVMGHLKFWGCVHNPKEQHDSRFFLPHLGQVHLVESEKELYNGAMHVRAVSQVLKPFSLAQQREIDAATHADNERSSPDQPHGYHLGHLGHQTSRSRVRWPEEMMPVLVGHGSGAPDGDVDGSPRRGDGGGGGGGGSRAGAGKSRGSLRWVHELHASYGQAGGHAGGQLHPRSQTHTSHSQVRRGASRAGVGPATTHALTSRVTVPLGGLGSNHHRPKTVPAALLLAGGHGPPADLHTPPNVSDFLTSSTQRLLPRLTMYVPAYTQDDNPSPDGQHQTSPNQNGKPTETASPAIAALTAQPLRQPSLPDGHYFSAPNAHFEPGLGQAGGNSGDGQHAAGTLLGVRQSAPGDNANRMQAPLPIQSLVFKRTAKTPGNTAPLSGPPLRSRPSNPPMLILHSLQPANTNRTPAPPTTSAPTSISNHHNHPTTTASDLGHPHQHAHAHARPGPTDSTTPTVPHHIAKLASSIHAGRGGVAAAAAAGAGAGALAVGVEGPGAAIVLGKASTSTTLELAATTLEGKRMSGPGVAGGGHGSRAGPGPFGPASMTPLSLSAGGGAGPSGAGEDAARLPGLLTLSPATSFPLGVLSGGGGLGQGLAKQPGNGLQAMPRLSYSSGVALDGAQAQAGVGKQPEGLGSLVQMEGRSVGKAPARTTRPIAGRVLAQAPLPPAGAVGQRSNSLQALKATGAGAHPQMRSSQPNASAPVGA